MMFFGEGRAYLRVSEEDWAEYRRAVEEAKAERDAEPDDTS